MWRVPTGCTERAFKKLSSTPGLHMHNCSIPKLYSSFLINSLYLDDPWEVTKWRTYVCLSYQRTRARRRGVFLSALEISISFFFGTEAPRVPIISPIVWMSWFQALSSRSCWRASSSSEAWTDRRRAKILSTPLSREKTEWTSLLSGKREKMWKFVSELLDQNKTKFPWFGLHIAMELNSVRAWAHPSTTRFQLDILHREECWCWNKTLTQVRLTQGPGNLCMVIEFVHEFQEEGFILSLYVNDAKTSFSFWSDRRFPSC